VKWIEPSLGRHMVQSTGLQIDKHGPERAREKGQAILDKIFQEIDSGKPIPDRPLTEGSLIPKPMDWNDPLWAYVMECPLCHKVKIGYTNDLYHRGLANRKAHRVRSGCELKQRLTEVIIWPGGGPLVEAHWHYVFRHLRIGKSEWFNPLSDRARAILRSADLRVREIIEEKGMRAVKVLEDGYLARLRKD
jgi:hypothetical protein